MWIKFHWKPKGDRPFFFTGWLPIHQRFIMIGPVTVHLAWGTSAKLIRKV